MIALARRMALVAAVGLLAAALLQLTARPGSTNSTDLTASGTLVITEPGTIVEGLAVTGEIVVKAPNVTIRGSQITSDSWFPIRIYSAGIGSTVIEDVTVTCTSSKGQAGIHPGGYSARRVEVNGCRSGLRRLEPAVIADSSWNGVRVDETGNVQVTQPTVVEEIPSADIDTSTTSPTTAPKPPLAAVDTLVAPAAVIMAGNDPLRADGTALDASRRSGDTLRVHLDVDDTLSAIDHVEWQLDGELQRDNDLDAPYDMVPELAPRSGSIDLSGDPGAHRITAVLVLTDGTRSSVDADFVVGARSIATTTTVVVAPPTTTPATTTTVPRTTTTTTTIASVVGTGDADTCAPQTADLVGWRSAGLTPDDLTPMRGELRITTPGAVIERFDLDGHIIVDAPNVTIRQARVRYDGAAPGAIRNNSTGLVIEQVELDGDGRGYQGVFDSDYAASGLHVHGFADGFKANGNVLIENSLVEYVWTVTGGHHDAVQSLGGSDITIQCNDLRSIGPDGSPAPGQILQLIGRQAGQAAIERLTITDNRLSGGSMGMRVAEATDVTVTGNVFVDGSWTYGPVAPDTGSVTGQVWANNRLESGATVPAPS